MGSIKDKLALPDAEAWRPEVGDQLIGTVVGVEERGTEEYGNYPCVIVLTEAGEHVAVHAFHSVLRNEIAKLKPEPGDDIGVEFRGEKKNAKGQKYTNYKVIVEKPDGSSPAAPDWDKHLAESGAELDAVDEDAF